VREGHCQALPDLQTFLRRLGIKITFSREGRTGTRMIRVTTSAENTDGTVVLPAKSSPGAYATSTGEPF